MKATKINKIVGSMENGSVFEHDGAFYMVTDKGNGRCTVCVDVNTGECVDFSINTEVNPRLAEVIIMNDVDE